MLLFQIWQIVQICFVNLYNLPGAVVIDDALRRAVLIFKDSSGQFLIVKRQIITVLRRLIHEKLALVILDYIAYSEEACVE